MTAQNSSPMFNLFGEPEGSLYSSEQLKQYASMENPVFTFDKSNKEFKEFARSHGYPVPHDDTLWCLDFMTPNGYRAKLQCLWELFNRKESVDMATIRVEIISKGEKQEQCYVLPGENPILDIFQKSTSKDYVGDLLKVLGLPEGVKSLTVHPDCIFPMMEFSIDIYTDPKMDPKVVKIVYSAGKEVVVNQSIDRMAEILKAYS